MNSKINRELVQKTYGTVNDNKAEPNAGATGVFDPPLPNLLHLVEGRALTKPQADWITAIWPDLDQDAFAHPRLRGVREHTRAYLKRVR